MKYIETESGEKIYNYREVCKEDNTSLKDYFYKTITQGFIGGFLILLAINTYAIANAEPQFNLLDRKRVQPIELHSLFENWIWESDYIDRTVDFLVKKEEFNPLCYKDAGGYSQGYGHKCIQPIISKNWSRKVLEKEVVRIRKMITRKNLSTDQLVGIISFLYNHPNTQQLHLKNINTNFDEFVRTLRDKAENYVWIDGVRYGGLLSRRKKELALITDGTIF